MAEQGGNFVLEFFLHRFIFHLLRQRQHLCALDESAWAGAHEIDMVRQESLALEFALHPEGRQRIPFDISIGAGKSVVDTYEPCGATEPIKCGAAHARDIVGYGRITQVARIGDAQAANVEFFDRTLVGKLRCRQGHAVAVVRAGRDIEMARCIGHGCRQRAER